MGKKKTIEDLVEVEIGEMATVLGLSYGHTRSLIKKRRLKPVRRQGNKHFYSVSQMDVLNGRNTKPGPKVKKGKG